MQSLQLMISTFICTLPAVTISEEKLLLLVLLLLLLLLLI